MKRLASISLFLCACGASEPAAQTGGTSSAPIASASVVTGPPTATASVTAAPTSSAAPTATATASSAPTSNDTDHGMVTGTADTPWGRDDSGGSDGTGATTGFGSGHGRLGGRTPSIRQGVTQVNGRLPPEVIQRIVRQNFGRFKLCYVEGLRSNAALAGTVTVHFVIGLDGSVTKTERDASTTMPDAAVTSCIVRGFSNLSYPQPESGTVSVVFPIILAPGP
jgi:hypothetical protein